MFKGQYYALWCYTKLLCCIKTFLLSPPKQTLNAGVDKYSQDPNLVSLEVPCVPSPTFSTPTTMDCISPLTLKLHITAENTNIHERGALVRSCHFCLVLLGALILIATACLLWKHKITTYSILVYNIFPMSSQQQLPSLQYKKVPHPFF